MMDQIMADKRVTVGACHRFSLWIISGEWEMAVDKGVLFLRRGQDVPVSIPVPPEWIAEIDAAPLLQIGVKSGLPERPFVLDPVRLG